MSSSSVFQHVAEVDCAVEEALQYLFESPNSFNTVRPCICRIKFPTLNNPNFMIKITFSTGSFILFMSFDFMLFIIHSL